MSIFKIGDSESMMKSEIFTQLWIWIIEVNETFIRLFWYSDLVYKNE